MWNFHRFNLLFSLLLTKCLCYGTLQQDIQILRKTFYDNLLVDPVLLADKEFTVESKRFVDKQLENQKELLLRVEEKYSSRTKRSISENIKDNYLDLIHHQTNHINKIRTYTTFQQNSNWYIAILQKDTKNNEQNIIVYKYTSNEPLEEILHENIPNGVQFLVSQELSTSTLLLIGENIKNSTNGFLKVYQFRFNEKISLLQTFNTSHILDVALWEDENGICMTYVQKISEESGNGTKLNQIYRWNDKKFLGSDDSLPWIDGLRQVIPFAVRENNYLAMANYAGNENSKTYTDILKFNYTSHKYEPYQRLLTKGCRDVKHFKIFSSQFEEHYLLVTNILFNDSIMYKYVDDYFIPFQRIKVEGILHWVPISFNNTFVMAAETLVGTKFYKYDYWRFVEVLVNFEYTSKISRQLKYNIMEEKPILFMIDGNSQRIDMYEVKFNNINNLLNQLEDMLNWCRGIKSNLDTQSVPQARLNGRMRGDMDLEEEESNHETTNFHHLDSDSLIYKEKFDTKSTTSKVLAILQNYQSAFREAEELSVFLQGTETKVIGENLTAEKIVMNSEAKIHSLNADSINTLDMKNILNNKININDGFQLNSELSFDSVGSNGLFLTQNINGQPIKKLVKRDKDLETDSVVIKGKAFLQNVSDVYNSINSMIFDKHTILLNSVDQNFDNFKADNIKIDSLDTKSINGLDVTSPELQGTKTSGKLTNLNVKKMFIGGYINDVDIPTLQKFSLKANGNQDMLQTYYFDTINVNKLSLDGPLSNKNILQEVVLTTNGDYQINKSVMFEGDVKVNNLTATESFNRIPVVDGKLEVLLKDTKSPQYISEDKSFKLLELMNPIKLQGKIKSKDLDVINPVVTVEKDLIISKNITIIGNVQISELLQAENIISTDPSYSLKRVGESGLKLNDDEILSHLDFTQQINTNEIILDEVNGINPNSWVENGKRETQIIQGLKRFPGNVKISGATRVTFMNNINLDDLEANVLRKNGDQIISGKHFINYVAVSDNSLTTNNISFGPMPWHDVLTTDQIQVITGTTTINNNLVANITHSSGINVKGLINGLKFNDIVDDAVDAHNPPSRIHGNKIFQNITIEDLTIENGLNLETINMLNDVKIQGDLVIDDSHKVVDNIQFTSKFNGMEAKLFEEQFKNRSFTENMSFNTIIVYGTAYVASNKINEYDIDDIKDKTVKIDENFEFDSVEFKNSIDAAEVINNGNIENFDIDNIVLPYSNIEQIVSDNKTFQSSIKVNGTTYFTLVNGFNVSSICDLSSSTKRARNLWINGNVHFSKNPKVGYLNDLFIQRARDAVWFKDKPTNMTNKMRFNEATFNENIELKGPLNQVRVNYLSENYFSKSKNQSIYSTLTFENGTIFGGGVSTPELSVKLVNDVDLKKFSETIVLEGFDQLFEDPLYFEKCSANSIKGDYLVNNMSLNDVMRYDKENMVTGPKTIQNLNVNVLTLPRNTTVQNVDVVNWLKGVIKKTGTFSISGTKTFNNVSLHRNLGLVQEMLNGAEFNTDTVLLKTLPQQITGEKTFISNVKDPIRFQSLKVNGQMNDINYKDLIESQAYKNVDNSFKSPMNLFNNLSTQNINIEKQYQNMNISELMQNISRLETVNNLSDHFRSLLDMSKDIKKSLDEPSSYLHHYQRIFFLNNVNKVFAINGEYDQNDLLAFSNINGSAIVRFYRWDEEKNLFLDTGSITNLGLYPTYVNKLMIGNRSYIYLENNNPYDLKGKLIHVENGFNLEDSLRFPNNSTAFSESFTLPNGQNCLVFVINWTEVNIICEENNGEFKHSQNIPYPGAQMVAVTTIEDTPYLFMNKIGDKDPCIVILKYNNETLEFENYQTFWEEASSITAAKHRDEYYLAHSFDKMPLYIKRFNKTSRRFEVLQVINTEHSITDIKFATLSSNDLLLYVVTKEPLLVYMHEGISGFNEKILSNFIAPEIDSLNWFSIGNKHFISAQHNDEIHVIQADLN